MVPEAKDSMHSLSNCLARWMHMQSDIKIGKKKKSGWFFSLELTWEQWALN